MKARGKRDAKRSASPLVDNQHHGLALKGRNPDAYFSPSGLVLGFHINQGRRAPALRRA